MKVPAVPPTLARGELAPLWRALHDRLSTGRPVSSVTVGPLDDDQRAAVADLLGLDRLPGPTVRVRLSTLDDLLRGSVGLDARGVVENLLGPLDDRAGRRAAAASARGELWAWLAGHRLVQAQPALGSWAADARQAGLVDGSVMATRTLLESALRVLAALPADGSPLPAFADAVLGDPHALDEGTRLSGLVLRALAALYGEPVPAGAEARRALWERAGVACDALSAQVLVAGLRPVGSDVLSRVLRSWAAAGHACAVTLEQLRGCPELCTAAGPVWVVENPSVMTMALRRFGDRCPPLVCTAGWPTGAGIVLLRMLARSGCTLHYHGDFDGEGLRIAAYVMAKTGAEPWRMSTPDYLAAFSFAAGRNTPGSAADAAGAATRNAAPDPAGNPVGEENENGGHGNGPGRVTDAPWDSDLADALRYRNVAVYEERVAEHLLADLNEHISVR